MSKALLSFLQFLLISYLVCNSEVQKRSGTAIGIRDRSRKIQRSSRSGNVFVYRVEMSKELRPISVTTMFHHLGNCYYRGSLSKRTFAFDKIAVKLQKKKKAFRLLVDIPDHFEDITDPSVDWSLELDLNNNNKARHLSWMLVVMKKVSEVQRPPNANNLLQIQ